MKLQQLRYLREIARQGLNLSAAADALYTSQPGISKQIKLLENELGIEIFVRNGKRVTEITPPGKTILAIAERILQETENLKRAASDYSNQDTGSLTVATTHTQARYALPDVIQRFSARYPKVKLGLVQGNPVQVCELVLGGDADICIATEAIDSFEDLVMLPCYTWNRCVIVKPEHPLLRQKTLTLEEIARYPIIT
jgi:LysR family transcriptional regulator, cys regulon transcriptional activator